MSERKSETARWAQVAATAFLGVVGLVFTGVLTYQQEKNRDNQFSLQARSDSVQFELQEQNRKTQVGLQLLSQREVSEMDFRQRMFEVLVAELLDTRINVRNRVARLQLFLDNFHDIFNARALFDVLAQDASRERPAARDSLITKLVSIARDVTIEQELLVGTVPNIILLSQGADTSFTLGTSHEEELGHESGKSIELAANGEPTEHEISIKLLEVKKNEVRLELNLEPGNPRSEPLRFRVSYFDAPLTDNTLFPDRHRFAITLKGTDMRNRPYTAKVNVFEFPADFVTTGYRPSIRESNKLIEAAR